MGKLSHFPKGTLNERGRSGFSDVLTTVCQVFMLVCILHATAFNLLAYNIGYPCVLEAQVKGLA